MKTVHVTNYSDNCFMYSCICRHQPDTNETAMLLLGGGKNSPCGCPVPSSCLPTCSLHEFWEVFQPQHQLAGTCLCRFKKEWCPVLQPQCSSKCPQCNKAWCDIDLNLEVKRVHPCKCSRHCCIENKEEDFFHPEFHHIFIHLAMLLVGQHWAPELCLP